MPAGRFLERVHGSEQPPFAQVAAGQLHSNGQPRGREAGRKANRRIPAEIEQCGKSKGGRIEILGTAAGVVVSNSHAFEIN